jgi:hypothetical protein
MSGYDAHCYAAALRDVASHHRRMLVAHYNAANRTVTATELSKAVGWPPGKGSANLHYGKLGRLVGERLGWRPLPKHTVNVLVSFKKLAREWHWIMRPAVAKALEQLGWIEGQKNNPAERICEDNDMPQGNDRSWTSLWDLKNRRVLLLASGKVGESYAGIEHDPMASVAGVYDIWRSGRDVVFVEVHLNDEGMPRGFPHDLLSDGLLGFMTIWGESNIYWNMGQTDEEK